MTKIVNIKESRHFIPSRKTAKGDIQEMLSETTTPATVMNLNHLSARTMCTNDTLI